MSARNLQGTYTEPTRNLHGTCMGSTRRRPLTPQHRTTIMHRTRGPPEAQTPDPGTLSPHPAPPSLDQRKVYTLAGRRSRCAMCLRTGTPPARTTRDAGAAVRANRC
jgi:hypothetical protein